MFGGGEEELGAVQVGGVGGGFAGEDGVVRVAMELGVLDFGVPVGAFDEAEHEAAVGSGGEVGEPVDDGRGAFLVGLDGEAKAVWAYSKRG